MKSKTQHKEDFIPLALSLYAYRNQEVRNHIGKYIPFTSKNIYDFTGYVSEKDIKYPIHSCTVAETEDYNVLTFRGTYVPQGADVPFEQKTAELDWVNNATFEITKFPYEIKGGAVHSGFLEAVNILWESTDETETLLVDRIKELMEENEKDLLITGYSKGGALAPIAATILSENEGISKEKMIIKIFEAPRAGNFKFKAFFQDLFPDARRYEYQDDIIVHNPCKASDAIFMKGLAYTLFEYVFPHPTAPAGELRSLIEPAFFGIALSIYQPVGTLRWVNWNNEITEIGETEETANNKKRLERIKELVDGGLESSAKLMADHSHMGHIWDVMCNDPWPPTFSLEIPLPTVAALSKMSTEVELKNNKDEIQA